MAGENDLELVEPEDLCPKCGNKMMVEDDVFVCPHCDAEIDYFGEEDES